MLFCLNVFKVSETGIPGKYDLGVHVYLNRCTGSNARVIYSEPILKTRMILTWPLRRAGSNAAGAYLSHVNNISIRYIRWQSSARA